MNAYTVERYARFWAVRDRDGELVCVCVYRRGAREVVRRLSASEPESAGLRETPPEPEPHVREPF
jgi:hypothetical protein